MWTRLPSCRPVAVRAVVNQSMQASVHGVAERSSSSSKRRCGLTLGDVLPRCEELLNHGHSGIMAASAILWSSYPRMPCCYTAMRRYRVVLYRLNMPDKTDLVPCGSSVSLVYMVYGFDLLVRDSPAVVPHIMRVRGAFINGEYRNMPSRPRPASQLTS